MDVASEIRLSNKLTYSGGKDERIKFTSDILKLLQVTDTFEKSCRVILEKLCDYVECTSATMHFVNGSNITLYVWDAIEKTMTVTGLDTSLSQTKYRGICERLACYGTAYIDKLNCSAGCEADFAQHKVAVYIGSITHNNDMIGYLSIADENTDRIWNSEIVMLMTDISQIVSGMLQQKFTQDALCTAIDTFRTVLDNIDSYVYVTDIMSRQIVFTNQKFVEAFGNNILGKQCSTVLGLCNPDDPDCNSCAILDIISERPSHTYERYCEATGQWFDVSERLVTWNDGRRVKLTTLNDITDMIEYERAIEREAFSDHLTGLANRRKLEVDLPSVVKTAVELGKESTLLFVDLDNFKNINDSLGHQYGDDLLKQVGSFFASLEGVVAYRFGGDEFVVLIKPEFAEHSDIVTSQVLDRFEKGWRIIDTDYYCTVSIGAVRFPLDGESYLILMKKADMALYNAKKLGKDRVIHFHRKIEEEALRAIKLENDMHRDVANGCKRFEVYYQPIISATNCQLVGAEALVRWHSESLGLIMPSEFIPIAESLGCINQLGDYVMREAIKQCASWRRLISDSFRVNINLSVSQLTQANIIERIKESFKGTGLPYDCVVFEVTESLAINDMDKMKDVLSQIRSLGANIALDDFGTGYSSLNCFKDMPLNTIKIDKTFLDDIEANPSTRLFVQAIVSLSHGLNMSVCAEGVETAEQLRLLTDGKVDVIQGYFFGKPCTAKEFEEKYSTNN